MGVQINWLQSLLGLGNRLPQAKFVICNGMIYIYIHSLHLHGGQVWWNSLHIEKLIRMFLCGKGKLLKKNVLKSRTHSQFVPAMKACDAREVKQYFRTKLGKAFVNFEGPIEILGNKHAFARNYKQLPLSFYYYSLVLPQYTLLIIYSLKMQKIYTKKINKLECMGHGTWNMEHVTCVY